MKTISHSSWLQVFTTEVVLFFALWLIYGFLINSNNIEAFGATTVAAIVEQHSFAVEGVTTWPGTESFIYNGHEYSNKQPGQAMVCAVVYSVLRFVGISYERDRVFAQALVIFFTASFLTALAGVVVFRLARELDDNESSFWPVAAALTFGLGTTVFAYSGIAHHDIIATAFLVIAVYLIFTLRRPVSSAGQVSTRAAVGGLLLGLTLTTSMLHFFMVAVAGIYFLTLRRWRQVPYLLFGGFVGLVPMLLYNWVNFGDPFLPAAVANWRANAYDPGVFLHFDLANFKGKIGEYADFVSDYAPVLWFGLLGLWFIQKKYRREKYLIALLILVLFLYVTNIDEVGSCAYGPRYLIPLMPFAALGVIGLRRIPVKALASVAGALMLLVGIRSVVVNLVGAMQGAMYCNLAKFGFPDYVTHIMNGMNPSYPLVPWLLPFAALLCVTVVLKIFARNLSV